MMIDRPAAEEAIAAFLRAIGRDPNTEPELAGTPARVTAAFIDELCGGYGADPAGLVKASRVASGGPRSTAVVALREIQVTTMCPHHLMPASGLGVVAFAPRSELVGLGALSELLDAYAHRLILQEEIGERVAATLVAELDARWAACRLVLVHGCVTARGERKHGARAETIAFVGAPDDRAEAVLVVSQTP